MEDLASRNDTLTDSFRGGIRETLETTITMYESVVETVTGLLSTRSFEEKKKGLVLHVGQETIKLG
jgi:hypothetical protein